MVSDGNTHVVCDLHGLNALFATTHVFLSLASIETEVGEILLLRAVVSTGICM